MNENKKRYPKEIHKLEALLDKKRADEQMIHAEVLELEARLEEARNTAIHASVRMYNITPEQLAELLQEKYGNPGIPQLPDDVEVAPALSDYSMIPEKEELADEDE